MSLRCVLRGMAATALRSRAPAASIHLVPARSAAAASKASAAGDSIMGLGKGKKKMGKLGAVEKRVLPVETDPERLASFVCGSNIYTSGEDVQIKPDAEYPEWLWSLRLGPPPPLEELSPDTKEYWLRVRAAGMRRNNKLRSLRRF